MGLTKKAHYDSYTLDYKIYAVKLTYKPKVMATDVAEALGIHAVMLYRWRMEFKNGTLSENKHMRKKKFKPSIDYSTELQIANKRIAELEKRLSVKKEEVDILKKARRFFLKAKK